MKFEELESKLKSNSEVLKKSIKLPCNVITIINEEEEVMKKKNIFKSIGFTLAGIAAAFVLVVNCIPKLAYASFDIPVLGAIVRVVTFDRFEVKNNGYEANVVTPQIEGLLDKELEAKLNNEFKEHSQLIIAAFENDIKELEKEFGEDFHLGVDANYTVRTDNENILVIDTYIVNTVGSSSTKHSFYTIDKRTGTLVELKGLFKDGADYISPISEYIKNEMRKANQDGTGNFWIDSEDNFEGFKKIKENQNFFINNAENIVIAFDKYEVAPGAYGSPEFEIPKEVIKDILK